MTRLVLVRHGEATAGWGLDHDPGLSELGHAQAVEAVDVLSARYGPDQRPAIRVSPLRRARETAAPLERAWARRATIDPVIRELPSPTTDLGGRAAWIRGALGGLWDDLHDEARTWRGVMVAAARALTRPEVWVTHYVVINAIVGAERDTDEVTVFSPVNCSITEVDVHDGELSVVSLGASDATEVG